MVGRVLCGSTYSIVVSMLSMLCICCTDLVWVARVVADGAYELIVPVL